MAKRVLQKNNLALHLFVDANVIIDTSDTGSHNHIDAVEFLSIATDNAITLYTASISIVFYAHTIKRFRTPQQIQTGISAILDHCNVLDVTGVSFRQLMKLNSKILKMQCNISPLCTKVILLTLLPAIAISLA